MPEHAEIAIGTILPDFATSIRGGFDGTRPRSDTAFALLEKNNERFRFFFGLSLALALRVTHRWIRRRVQMITGCKCAMVGGKSLSGWRGVC
jgi:hypothetical protein